MYGDSAVLLTALDDSEAARSERVQRLARRLLSRPVPGLLDVIQAFDTLLVELDCVVVTPPELVASMVYLLSTPDEAAPKSRLFEVPVVYGGAFGPDLVDAARDLDWSASELAAHHQQHVHTIACVVSPPGAPMSRLPGLPAPVPRLLSPRPRVPAGSVALAGQTATIYATGSPGGWRIIGRTPARLFEPNEAPPVRFYPGDRLKFVPINPEAWTDHGDRALEPCVV